jgi:hypothetical protein
MWTHGDFAERAGAVQGFGGIEELRDKKTEYRRFRALADLA